jgi:hypothetical protein
MGIHEDSNNSRFCVQKLPAPGCDCEEKHFASRLRKLPKFDVASLSIMQKVKMPPEQELQTLGVAQL